MAIDIDIKLTGRSEDSDNATVGTAFERFVKALRKQGFTVNGQIATSTLASRDEAGELVPAEGRIFFASDVD